MILTIEEYRDLLKDYVTSEEQIKKRVNYLETFCRKIIRMELEKPYEQSKKTIQ